MWTQREIQTIHRQSIAENEGARKIIGVLETTLYLLQGQTDFVYRTEHPLDPLERFVIRCLLELTSCTDQQIASLLGFKNVSFVSTITRELEREGNIVLRGETWGVTGTLRQEYERGTKFVTRVRTTATFWYEWVSKTFLPSDFLPTRSGGTELTVSQNIEVDPISCIEWAREHFFSGYDADTGIITWEHTEDRSQWQCPLQAIAYQEQSETTPIHWQVYYSGPQEFTSQLKDIAARLNIESAISNFFS